MPDPDATSSLAEQVVQLARDLSSHQVVTTDYERVLRRIRGYIATHFRSLASAEQASVADIALMRLVHHEEHNNFTPLSDAYVWTTVHNASIDRIRELARVSRREIITGNLDEFSESLKGSDDNVAASFNHLATAQIVEAALLISIQRHDNITVKVVTTALNRTQEEGERPSNRSLATDLKISHTAVAKALTRFRQYMEQAAND